MGFSAHSPNNAFLHASRRDIFDTISDPGDLSPEIQASMQRARSAAEAELRSRGMGDAEIRSWLKTLTERARKRSPKEFRAPSVAEVLAKVDLRAPSTTLRRKASCRILRN